MPRSMEGASAPTAWGTPATPLGMPGLLDTATAIPRVETERLLLRGHRLGDLEAASAMWGDAEVARYIGGKAFGRDEVWMRLLRYVGHWPLLGFGMWAVREKGSGRYAGAVGFFDGKRGRIDDLPGHRWHGGQQDVHGVRRCVGGRQPSGRPSTQPAELPGLVAGGPGGGGPGGLRRRHMTPRGDAP